MTTLLVTAGCCGPTIESTNGAKEAATRVQIRGFLIALEHFHSDTGRYPTQSEGLRALRVVPHDVKGWQGPYLPKEIPTDLWGHPYRYRAPTAEAPKPMVASDGPPR